MLLVGRGLWSARTWMVVVFVVESELRVSFLMGSSKRTVNVIAGILLLRNLMPSLDTKETEFDFAT